MHISKLVAKNFRCLRDVSIDTDRLTTLIGANGTGKSTLLHALEFFFAQRTATDLDAHGEDPSLSIEVGIELDGLSERWRTRLASYVDSQGRVTLVRRSTPSKEGRQVSLVAWRQRAPTFSAVRQAATAADLKTEYERIRSESAFSELPTYQNKNQAIDALDAWERSHQDQLESVEEPSPELGGMDLSAMVRPVFVPAVWEASEEAVEARGSVFGQLVNLLIQPRLTSLSGELGELESRTAEQYRGLVTAEGDQALEAAGRVLSKRLAELVPNSAISLEWQYYAPVLKPPSVKAKISEGGFSAEVGRQGHGVQRAYLLALLQELAAQELTDQGESFLPSALLVIEEPELYQHPVQARLLARLLRTLTEDPNGQLQIVYATHSPFFVSLDAVSSLRLFRLRDAGVYPETSVSAVDLARAAERLWEASGSEETPFSAESLRARLRLLMDSPVSEGFFARTVVLVEGVEDYAMIRASAAGAGVDFDQLGVAVVPVGGKTNLDRPLIVFDQMQIPTYVVFDGDSERTGGDRDQASRTNRLLLQLLGVEPEDFPNTQVDETWACFGKNMRATVAAEVGEVAFATALQAEQRRLGVVRHGEKNPLVVQATMARLKEQGLDSPTLTGIIRGIVQLAGRQVRRQSNNPE